MNPVLFLVIDQFGTPIANGEARVVIFQNGSILTLQDTDANGETNFLLADGTYVVRVLITSGAYVTPTPVTTVIASGANDYELEVERLVYDAVTTPGWCVCGGYVNSVSENQLVFQLSQVTPFGRYKSPLEIVAPIPTELRMDPEESHAITLPAGMWFRITMDRFPTWMIKVPSLASASLQDVLFPSLVDVVVEDGSSTTVAVGETTTLGYDELYSSGLVVTPYDDEYSIIDQVISEAEDSNGLVFFSSDTSVASVSKSDDGRITIHGISAGTATISVTVNQLFVLIGEVEQIDDVLTVVVN